MPTFSKAILDFWRQRLSGEAGQGVDGFTLAINPSALEEDRLTILERADGTAQAAIAPDLAERAGLTTSENLESFRNRLASAGIALYEPDLLYYVTEEDKASWLREPPDETVRRLTFDDSALFTEFENAASEQDRDDAYVELDHLAVFGAFEAGRLVAATSIYLWQGTAIADVGVLTLVPFRGRGHARSVVRAIGRYALEQGYDVQYRHQPANHGSAGVARAAGLTLFGSWQVLSPDFEG